MLNETWLLIANPTSGGGKLRQKQAKIEQTLNLLNIPYVLRLTQREEMQLVLHKKALPQDTEKSWQSAVTALEMKLSTAFSNKN
jgi:hypothetical protein